MREIKFRVWDIANKRMVFDPYKFRLNAYSDENRINRMEYIFYETAQDVEDGVDRPCELMQFTGRKDKNGKEIYEGDVVETKFGPRTVYWGEKYAAFLYDQPVMTANFEQPFFLFNLETVVLGNRFEHPELLTSPPKEQ